MWDIKVGDKVTPVRSWTKRSERYEHEIFPSLGTVYTVRSVFVVNGLPSIHLVEIVNKPDVYSVDGCNQVSEVCFILKYFRKVISNKGMDELTKFLSNPQSKVTNNGFGKKVKRKIRA
jgi:hypothetical protein